MARTRPHRPPYDARHEFVVTPPAGRLDIQVGGRVLPAGSVFDKTLVDARRLAQMYEARLLAVAPGSSLPSGRPARPLAIGPIVEPALEYLPPVEAPQAAPAAEVPAPPRPRAKPRAAPRQRASQAA